MIKLVTITEISRNLADFVNRVLYLGDSFQILKGKRVVAELKPPNAAKKFSELPAIFENIPALVEQDRIDLFQVRKDLKKKSGREKLKNPWDA